MKTLLITENFPPKAGGSGRWFWELYSRLPEGKYQILAGEDSSAVQFDANASINIQRENLTSSEWGFVSRIGLKFYFRTALCVRKIIKKNNITELHCGRVLPEGVVAWLLNIFTGIPYICYVHGEDLETAQSSREQYFICGQVIKRAKKVICNSQNSAKIVAKFGPEAEAKTKVLHPGVDSNQFVPKAKDESVLASLGWTGKQVALTVGRLQARKGQDMMIKAVPEIIKKIPNFLYAIVGGGEQKEELVKLVDELGLQPHVQFLSEISDQDMIACYQQCDLFILPNRTIGQDIEGFGMVLVEAQSCGKPVIAGDSGGTKETMLVGESGLVIDATRPQNIANSVIELMSDKEKMLDMGRKGRAHVIRSLDWKALTQTAIQKFS
ncbi:glycosyltransferase family 4 protein [Paraglaciecola aquimarina]|uniref:Glycosyltransferase family 4 protein n=1 Tax=Paraglaciecola algarum TaxID=3050085 RepID=A0ABS9D5Q5_9ALTE|nr:glycosyltransferase family 4 protein [Paraglaciecola sp. G1-23]MCF2947760.1 glycosyltransferase family 4 protein [Paraglaciecola sp. G1-23]